MTTENEKIGWHHQLKGHELDQTPGDVEGHGSLACSNSWGPKDSDKTQQLNNDNNIHPSIYIYIYLKESQIQAFQLSRSELLVLPSLCLIINILLIVVLMFLFKLMF